MIGFIFLTATIAVLVGVVLWVLLLNSLMPLQPKSLTPKLLACMVPTMSIVWSVRIMTIFHTKSKPDLLKFVYIYICKNLHNFVTSFFIC